MEDMITTNGISSITNETGERYVGYFLKFLGFLFIYRKAYLPPAYFRLSLKKNYFRPIAGI